MRGRIPVFIYASDPISAAGAKAQLLSQPTIELVGPADVDRARVALVVTEAVDEAAARVVMAIQRDRVPRVVLVASRFDEEGVVAAVAAGVTAFVRRADAVTAKLVPVIEEADRNGCQLPGGLQRRAAELCPSHDMPLVPTSSGPCGTLTGLRLSAREEKVLRLVAEGYDTADIAGQLSFSESTIKGILAKLMSRVDARNRCHAVAMLVREGVI